MKSAIVIGLNSDIAADMSSRLAKDGWFISGSMSKTCDLTDSEQIERAAKLLSQPWDLLIIAAGTLEPVKRFVEANAETWERSVQVNVLGPLRMLRLLLPSANEGATVVFFSGTNPLRRNPLYSAYSSSKAMLVRAAEEIDAEVDAKICVMAPGYVATKIHRVHVVNRKDSTDPEAIYKCLLYMIARPKKEVGGKVIHVPTWAKLAIEYA